MSLMVDGRIRSDWLEAEQEEGRFVRRESQFRNWVTPDGGPGPSGEGGFPAEAGRYHLYVSYACPWAHRTLIFRRLKGLEDLIGVTVVHPHMLEQGWKFEGECPDHLYGWHHLYQAYAEADPRYSGIVTVPVLWDRERRTIVSNESSEIIRMLNSAFDGLTGSAEDFYPPELRSAIDEINAWVYSDVNDGVYRTGFAANQAAYEEAFDRLFSALDRLEQLLSRQRYLTGARITEADWRLFTTLVRFDAVYYVHFKCNLWRIADRPNLSGFLRELYQWPGIAETVHFDHIKQHYYVSHPQLNPTGIVPKGPLLDLDAPHGRDRF